MVFNDPKIDPIVHSEAVLHNNALIRYPVVIQYSLKVSGTDTPKFTIQTRVAL
jgi:hypothetical protein